MESELLKALAGNPIFGGGTFVGGILGLLYLARKAYVAMKQDSATADAVTMSLASQAQVIEMLRAEVKRLADQVQLLQEALAKQADDKRNTMDELVITQRELQRYKNLYDQPVVTS